jgi:OPA family glycerol-3-phosphate transporter-like MFS transporter
MGAPPHDKRLFRWQILLLALLLTSYSGFYLCRSNLSVTIPFLQEYLVEQHVGIDPSTDFDLDAAKIQLGRVVTVGILAYALGKFLAGGLADRFGGRRTFLAGLTGSICFTILFALGGTLPLFTLAWMGNRLFQSCGWPGMVKLSGRWFSYARYGTVMGILSLSYLFGDAVAKVFLGVLIGGGLSWWGIFLVCGAVLFALLVLNLLLLRETPAELGLNEPAANPLNLYGKAGEQSTRPPVGSILLPLLRSPAFWCVCFLSLGLTLLRETFNTWTPTYFKEAVGLSPAIAARYSALFPFCGGLAVVTAGYGSDLLGRGGRALIITAGMLLTTIALIALGMVDPEQSPAWPVILVAIIGFLMLAPYSYLAGAISLDFGGKKGSATACGIIDGVGYLGATLSGEGVARLSVKFGWHGAFLILAGVALVSGMAGLPFWLEQRNAARKAIE